MSCPTCEGSGEIVEFLGQDRFSGLIHERTWPCHNCDGTGEAPALQDGLTDEQYDALVLADTTAPTIPPMPPVTAWECSGQRSCHELVDEPHEVCSGCLREVA